MDKKKIFIVEDEVIVAEDMRGKLHSLGYEVIGHAMDYEQAISLLEELHPDIALIDVNLGGSMDGIDVSAFIRQKMNIPLILVTANSDKSTVLRAREIRPDGYIVKPFEKGDLYTSIEMALAGREEKEEDSASGEAEFIISDSFFIRNKHILQKVSFESILYLKAEGNYTRIVTEDQSHLVRGNLKEISESMPGNFFRVHRSYVVNLRAIDQIEPTCIRLGKEEVALGQSYREELLDRLKTLS